MQTTNERFSSSRNRMSYSQRIERSNKFDRSAEFLDDGKNLATFFENFNRTQSAV